MTPSDSTLRARETSPSSARNVKISGNSGQVAGLGDSNRRWAFRIVETKRGKVLKRIPLFKRRSKLGEFHVRTTKTRPKRM